jgi:hypothetical protein
MARLQTGALFRRVEEATLERTHEVLVVTAKREHAKIMRTDPRPGAFRRFVDETEGAPEERVRPFGVIEYVYSRLDVVAQFAMEVLFDLSPVLSGEYRNAHSLFLNGAAVPNLKGWKSGDEVVILNPLPYARKIERGAMKMRVPGTDHVYQQAEQIVRRRYGNLANVRFTYRSPVMAYQPAGTRGAAQSRVGGAERTSRVPALSILER